MTDLAAVDMETISRHIAWLGKEATRADMRGGGHGQQVGCEPGAGHRRVAAAIDALLAALRAAEADGACLRQADRLNMPMVRKKLDAYWFKTERPLFGQVLDVIEDALDAARAGEAP